MQLQHLQLLDSALPVGAFSHSFGLETLVQENQVQTAAELRAFCESALWGVWAPCDLMLVVANYQCKAEAIWQLDRQLHASRAASESREGARKIGKRLLELGRALHPDLGWEPLETALASGACVGAHATIYGWLCRQLEVPLAEAATGFLLVSLNGCVGNAIRAMRLGQTQGQQIIAALLPQIERAWQQNKDQTPESWASNLPQLEIAQMRHARLYSRLFMS